MKKKVMDGMAKFSKYMVQPLMYVSVLGILLLVGILLTNQGITDSVSFLKWGPIPFIGKLIYESLMFIINNLGILFAVGIAGAMAKSSRQQASLISLMSYFVFLKANNLTLEHLGKLAEQTQLGLTGTGQTQVFGIQVLDTGVFSGIIIGLLIGFIFNKYNGKTFKGYFSMFSGERFPFVIAIILMMFIGWGTAYVWPIIQAGINSLIDFIAKSGNLGLFTYGVLNKLLLPTGLHHLLYTPFMFSNIGGTIEVGGQMIQGAYAVRTAEMAAGLPFSDSIYWMSFTFINLFGYIGAALAFYKTAKPENKEKVKALLLPLTIAVVMSSISEPFDFLFCFAAPILYLVFSIISGASMVLLKVFNLPVGTSGGLINTILGNLIAGFERTHWPYMFILGAAVIVVVYVSFVFLIQKLNLKTPGREDVKVAKDVQEDTVVKTPEVKVPQPTGDNDLALSIIQGLGGKENIASVDNCFTRLRVTLKDIEKLDEDLINTTGNSGIIKKDSDIQIIYGPTVAGIKKSVEESLA